MKQQKTLYIVTSYAMKNGGVAEDEMQGFDTLRSAEDSFSFMVESASENHPDWIEDDENQKHYFCLYAEDNFTENRIEIQLRKIHV